MAKYVGPLGPPRIQFNNSGSSILPPRHSMSPGQFLESPSKRFQLILQNDMNLALYEDGRVVWLADGGPFTSVINNPVAAVPNSFYIYYSAVLVDHIRSRSWSTVGSTPPDEPEVAANRTYLQLQDDGNLVIIDQMPRWYAPGVPLPDIALPSVVIRPGTTINAGDAYAIGKSRLVFQGDGNLVFYGENDRVLWHSQTHGKGGTFAAMQGDGNFVIYNAAKQPIWNTNTAGYPDAYARIQENGCFSIVTDRVCWARFGYTPTIKPVRVYYPNHADPIEQGHDPFPTYGHIGFDF